MQEVTPGHQVACLWGRQSARGERRKQSMNREEYGWPYPNQVGQEEVIESDVLVLGGGLSGCFAAIAAARKGCSVVVVEKRGCHKKRSCRDRI